MALLDHVDARVRSLKAVRPLYDALMSALGHTEFNEDAESIGYHRSGERGSDGFLWLVQDANHRSNETRIAFAAESRQDVDRIAVAVREFAHNFEAPAIAKEYGPYYYAAFFEDAEGNKLEICVRR